MKKAKKLVILLVIVIVIGFILFIKSGKKSMDNGNFSNMGLCVQNNGVVYFNKYEKGIFSYENKKETKLTDETAYSLNIQNGKIYYLTVENFNNVVIKSVDITGENRKKIATIYTSISKIFVDNNSIYYCTNQGNGGIAKMNLDGTNENIIISGKIQDFALYKGNLYYINNENKICKISKSGENNLSLSELITAQKFQIVDDWIYYYYETENSLFRVKLDGNNNELVSVLVNNETYNIYGKYVYYFDKDNSKIARMKVGQSNQCDDIVDLSVSKTKINIANDEIYYLDKSQDESQTYQIYRVKLNGEKTENINY